jgi:MFS family permease
MVNLRISVRRPVLMTNLASLLLGLAMFANMLLTTQQLQLPATTGYGLGLNVSVAGLCMVPSGLAMVVFAPLSGRIIRAFGGKVALIIGAAVMIVGYVGRIFFYDSVAVVIIGATVVSIGTAVGYAAAPALIMGAVPVTETASANGLNSLLRSIGSSISSAVIGAVLATVTMMVGSTLFPSFEAFRTLFLMAALASAASALAAVFIPKTSTGSGARLLDGENLRTGHAGTPSDTRSEAVTAPAGVTLLQTR